MAHALSIYLQDHLAGSMFGLELAQRCRRNNADNEFTEPLTELVADIEEDRRTLIGIMRELSARPSRLKVSAAWALEKAHRLKPNGRLVGYTPLARVVELESLAVGIAGKRALWRALEAAGSPGRALRDQELVTLVARADDQLRRVDALRLEAARLAFTGTGPRAEKATPPGRSVA